MTPVFPRTVTVYGTGLMGSSLALALRRAVPDIRIHGVDSPNILQQAAELGIIDRTSAEQAGLSELAILAAPVGAILELIERLPSGHQLILDVGSTKVNICRKAASLDLAFVGGHPMTGLERSGPEAASADLFANAPFFLCPISTSPPDALPRLSSLVTAIGAIPRVITPEAHDQLVAQLSHLPQILSTLVADQTAASCEFAGPGWKSVTRLAASPFHVWRDIFATSGPLPRELRSFVERLQLVINALEAGDMATIERLFERANQTVSGSQRD